MLSNERARWFGPVVLIGLASTAALRPRGRHEAPSGVGGPSVRDIESTASLEGH
jgi:hypothetical protein